MPRAADAPRVPPRKPRIPSDVARVVDAHQKLGDAARRALHVSEKVEKRNVQDAARAADKLRKRLRG